MPVKSKKIDHYEKRFGVVAIEKGFITADELINGLKVQVQEDVGLGYHRLIGEILLDWCVFCLFLWWSFLRDK